MDDFAVRLQRGDRSLSQGRNPEAEAELRSAEPGEPVRYTVAVRIPAPLTGEQAERIKVIAGKCPVHRTLTGEEWEEFLPGRPYEPACTT